MSLGLENDTGLKALLHCNKNDAKSGSFHSARKLMAFLPIDRPVLLQILLIALPTSYVLTWCLKQAAHVLQMPLCDQVTNIKIKGFICCKFGTSQRKERVSGSETRVHP